MDRLIIGPKTSKRKQPYSLCISLCNYLLYRDFMEFFDVMMNIKHIQFIVEAKTNGILHNTKKP